MPETGNVVCVEDFFATIESYLNKEQVEFVRKAYDVAAEAHASQRRKSGEPYIIHPLGVATILSQLQLDELTLAAAFLHDVVEDTDISLDSLKESFGQKVADLVDGVTKLGKIEYISKEEQQIENYRKMFLAMAKDIRVVMIKLADRLHNMRTMKFMPVHKQQSISRETMEIYAPLAHRLGIYTIKWELEDLAFRYMEPEIYYDLVEQVKVKRREREAMVHSAMGEIKEHLDSMNITCEIQGRPKNFYSIHKKMLRDHKELSEIYDLLAIRVLVDSVKDCYGTLGVVHSMWRPIPGRFKDYVAVPKSNMYQSLHTTVLYGNGQPLEIQIRTFEMHRISEYGIAAHWRYKEGNKGGDKDFDKKVAWLRQVLEWQDTSNPTELINALKLDVFSGEVFVFTPKGDVVKLPKGSVPLDFAYRVHTDVGHRTVGAKVNDKMVPLDYRLQNGDIVEIITSKTGKPSLDWLSIVGSAESRNKIRNWFKKENREENIEQGREALEREAKRLGYHWKELSSDEYLEDAARGLKMGSISELLASVGFGGTSSNAVLLRLIERLKKDHHEAANKTADNTEVIERLKARKQEAVPAKGGTGILVKGESGLMVRMARCCNPVPGDPIIGFITKGSGISVHRADCPNMRPGACDVDRLIEVEWDGATTESFQATLELDAYDRNGLLMDVMATLSELKINVINVNSRLDEAEKQVHMSLIIDVKNVPQLEFVMTKLRRVKDVYTIRRTKGGGM